jgi:eukaryotic-like serine/threonine-protein kinase
MMLSTLATVPAEPSAALRTLPRLIGRFSVRSEIGRGSNGVVYAAVDPMLGREIAIKAIPLSTDDFFRRQIEANFLQEAKSAAILNHQGIVTVFDAGKTEDLAYIAMERLHGRDLHEFLAAGQTLDPIRAAALMARVADAVHYAHKQGLIHRDIKPSNIFLLRDGKPKVLDFGIALANRPEGPATQKRQLIGTPNYMSPEQALGRKLDARSDVFSLGAILYELLAGRRAFEGKTIEDTVSQVIANTPAPLDDVRPELPRPLIEIVQRAMAGDLEVRYASSADLRNALAAFGAANGPNTARRGTVRDPAEVPAAPAGWWAELLDSARRAPWLTTAVALLAVAALGLAAFSISHRGGGETASATANGAGAPPAAPSRAPATASQGVAPADPVTSLPPPAPAVAPAPNRTDATQPAEGVPETPRPAVAARRPRVEPAPAPIAPPPADGVVSLAVTPWGEVFVDGASRGVSPPLTRLPLSVGLHNIEIRNGDAPAFTARVEIRPGQTLSVQHRF